MDSVTAAYTAIVREQQEEVNEGFLKNAAVSATIAIGAIASQHNMIQAPEHQVPTVAVIKKDVNAPDHLFSAIKSKFKHIDETDIHEIVSAAVKHGDPVFPQAHHLVALAGVESSMDPSAKSALKKDPAIGLTQIRPKVWNIDKKELRTVDGQISHSARILKKYHSILGNPEDTFKAYNIGITNHKRGKQPDAADRYHEKIANEISRIASL